MFQLCFVLIPKMIPSSYQIVVRFVFALFLTVKMGINGLQRSSAMFAIKGYRLQGHVIRTTLVTSSIECGQNCLMEQRCESFNYHHLSTDNDTSLCELNNSTKNKNEEKFEEDASTTYHYLMSQPIEPGQEQANPNEMTTETSPTSSPLPVFKSCLDVQTYKNTHTDGEYPLQINYPTCNETVQIYCADMHTTQPLEYLTLKAGSVNNFSKKNYVGSIKQSTSASSKTVFSKIRIRSDLRVERGNFRFASITWSYFKQVYIAYAAAADCHYRSCSSTKYGVFKMDLTGTGMRFVTPIHWIYDGYHGCSGNTPNQYSVSSTKQVVSGRCGGYCGSCWAKTLYVKPVGC